MNEVTWRATTKRTTAPLDDSSLAFEFDPTHALNNSITNNTEFISTSSSSLLAPAAAHATTRTTPARTAAPPAADAAFNNSDALQQREPPRRLKLQHLPLHCKGAYMDLPFGDIDAVCKLPSADANIQAACREQSGWLTDPQRYAHIPTTRKVPYTSLSTADVKITLQSRTIAPIAQQDIKGPVICFAVPEKDDTRRRAIKNPQLANDHLGANVVDKNMQIAGKRVILATLHKGTFFAQFDGTAWFDQFRLVPDIAARFCFRKGRAFYQQTALLMGLRISPQVGQAAMRQIANVPGNRTTRISCIDNCLLVGTSVADVLADLAECGRRAASCNFTLNEAATIATDPASMVATTGIYGGIAFDLVTKETWLPQRIVDKIVRSWSNRDVWNVRGFCVHIGLLLWSVDILDVPQADYFALFQFVSRISVQMQAAGHTAEAWAGPIAIWPSAMRALEQWTDLCVANRKKRQVPRPAREDATWLVATDACRDGFGYVALNQTSGEVRMHGARWPRQFRAMHYDKLHRSVFTEPHGVLMSMCHLLQHTGRKQHVVIGTDNVATEVSFNKRHNNHSFWINECVRRLHQLYPADLFSFELGFIPGETNVKLADPLSRSGTTSETVGAIAERLRQTLGGAAQGPPLTPPHAEQATASAEHAQPDGRAG
jgi:hypothetical protein